MNNKYPKLHNFNEMYTPDGALDIICKYLPRNWVYWEACYGKGHMADALNKRGFDVVGSAEIDCLTSHPTIWDCWITNPPFNGNKKFIKRAVDIGKPFVFLLRLEHLGGVQAADILGNIDFSILIPRKRINYITPKVMRGEKTGGSQFHSIWLIHGFDICDQDGNKRQIVYERD